MEAVFFTVFTRLSIALFFFCGSDWWLTAVCTCELVADDIVIDVDIVDDAQLFVLFMFVASDTSFDACK